MEKSPPFMDRTSATFHFDVFERASEYLTNVRALFESDEVIFQVPFCLAQEKAEPETSTSLEGSFYAVVRQRDGDVVACAQRQDSGSPMVLAMRDGTSTSAEPGDLDSIAHQLFLAMRSKEITDMMMVYGPELITKELVEKFKNAGIRLVPHGISRLHRCDSIASIPTLHAARLQSGEEAETVLGNGADEADREAVRQHVCHFTVASGVPYPTERQLARALARLDSGKVYLLKIKSPGATPRVKSMLAIPRQMSKTVSIGMVTTLPENANKGYATQLVAQVSQIMLKRGLIVLLFTDVKNPHSNHIYHKIGFHPVADFYEFAPVDDVYS